MKIAKIIGIPSLMVTTKIQKIIALLCASLVTIVFLYAYCENRNGKQYGKLQLTYTHVNRTFEELGIEIDGGNHDPDSVHILTSLDEKMLVGLPVLINSIMKNTDAEVYFHIIWCANESARVIQYLSCFNIRNFSPGQVEVVEAEKFMTDVFWSYLGVSEEAHKALGSCANILRLQAHRIFPQVDKVIWLDVDMVVQGDVAELWKLSLHGEWIMMSLRQTLVSATFKQLLHDSPITRRTSVLYQDRYGKPFNMSEHAFNNAVSLLNLRKWRLQDSYLQSEYEFWMKSACKLNGLKGFPWWHWSSQSIMWFTYRNNYTIIPIPRWHLDGLGWAAGRKVTQKMARQAKLLHWNGGTKPWMHESAHLHSFWVRNIPGQCNDTGSCVNTHDQSKGLFYRCVQDH